MKRLALLSLFALSIALPAAADMLPGYDRFDLAADHRARPVAASIWYPAANRTYRAPVGDGPIFDPTFAFIGPAIAEGEHPLVLLSHGSGGNADALGWLATGLVARGAIVLAVNHPGSTSGDSSPRRSVDLGARAKDLSAALDMIFGRPCLRPVHRRGPDWRCRVLSGRCDGAWSCGPTLSGRDSGRELRKRSRSGRLCVLPSRWCPLCGLPRFRKRYPRPARDASRGHRPGVRRFG